MSKPFLIIQLRPENEAADSEFEAIVKYGGSRADESTRARVEHSGLPEIELGDYSAIIVGGSPFDVSTPEDAKREIQKTIERDFMNLFERVVTLDFPFLGACSGNSLLGTFCGARVSRIYGEPVGGADVTLTEEGTKDPLLQGFPETFRVLLGHKEACDDLTTWHGPAGIVGNDCGCDNWDERKWKRDACDLKPLPSQISWMLRERVDADEWPGNNRLVQMDSQAGEI